MIILEFPRPCLQIHVPLKSVFLKLNSHQSYGSSKANETEVCIYANLKSNLTGFAIYGHISNHIRVGALEKPRESIVRRDHNKRNDVLIAKFKQPSNKKGLSKNDKKREVKDISYTNMLKMQECYGKRDQQRP